MATLNLNATEFNSRSDLARNPGFQSSVSVESTDVVQGKKYNPFEHRDVKRPNSVLASIIHLLKGCLGTGLLAMPSAFHNAGYVTGVIGTVLVAFICTYTVHIFVKLSQKLCVEARRPLMNYAETAGEAFRRGPPRLRVMANTVEKITDAGMILTYMSLLCVYVVFIATSFKEVLDVMFPDNVYPIQWYTAATLVPLVLLCQIRSLKYLVPFSMAANVMLLSVFFITMYFLFSEIPSFEGKQMIAPVAQWPLFFSTVTFAMEGIGVVMPIENEMKEPEKFLASPGVLKTSMAVVVLLYTTVGLFGYMKYGDDVKGSVTLNLPEDNVVAQSTKILMAFVIYFSYALQFYVVMEAVTRRMKSKEISGSRYNVLQVLIRTLFTVGAVAVATAFPRLELVISLVGAIFFSTLGILIPVVVDSVYHWHTLRWYSLVLWMNVIFGIMAVMALVTGSYTAIKSMAEEFI